MDGIITSRHNENVVRLRKLASSRKFRRESSEFICEGIKLFREAVTWGADIKTIFISDELDDTIPEKFKCHRVSRDIIEYVSAQKNPQNIIFTCSIKPKREFLNIKSANILLENIQDPGNLGTILRSADAFGIKSVMLLGECADPYNSKTVRASMGAVFRSNIAEISYSDLECFIADGMVLYGASLGESSRSILDVNLKNVTVAIGNEGNGLSKEILNICSEHIIIPIKPDCESLNAGTAAAIVMWEMSKSNI